MKNYTPDNSHEIKATPRPYIEVFSRGMLVTEGFHCRLFRDGDIGLFDGRYYRTKIRSEMGSAQVIDAHPLSDKDLEGKVTPCYRIYANKDVVVEFRLHEDVEDWLVYNKDYRPGCMLIVNGKMEAKGSLSHEAAGIEFQRIMDKQRASCKT